MDTNDNTIIKKIEVNFPVTFPRSLVVIIAEYATPFIKIELSLYDGNSFDDFSDIRENGRISNGFFLKVNCGGFTIGNFFGNCDHEECGAYSDTDCEEELNAVELTVERGP